MRQTETGRGSSPCAASRAPDSTAPPAPNPSGECASADDKLRQHRLSAAIPGLSTEEFAELVKSIQLNSLRDAIWLYEGEILDGWHRYLACLAVGVEPRYREYTGDQPASFVLRQHMSRGHTLTKSQAAAAAAAVEPYIAEESARRMLEGSKKGGYRKSVEYRSSRLQAKTDMHMEPKRRDHKREIAGRSDQQAAEALGTNRHYVRDYKLIERADATLATKIRSGEMSIPRAKRILIGHPTHETYPLSRFSDLIDTNNSRAVATNEGFVYLLRSDATGWSKIGYSIDPEQRLEELQNEWPELGWQLVASAFSADCAMVEAKLHRIFSLRRVARGREWFRLSVDEIERFGALVASLSTSEVLAEGYSNS